MQKSDFERMTLPKSPGVYFFRDGRRRILYIGKATNLRARVRSYFAKDIRESRGALIEKMVNDAKTLDWQETDSVLEALILEANLIKKYQPPANTDNKDNKSFNYLVITQEDFPRVLIVRGRELFTKWYDADIKYLFGPFPQGGVLKDALKIVRKIFPFRDRCAPASPARTKSKPNAVARTKNKPCFNAQIGLCPGVCSGAISKREYARIIRNIVLFFKGKKSKLIAQLRKEMQIHAQKEAFEQAATLRNQIFALEHINDAHLIGEAFRASSGGNVFSRIEAYDVAHISETARVGVMVVLEDGEPAKREYRKFIIQTKAQGDTAALYEIMTRRFDNEWQLPKLIVVDGGTAQINVAKRVLKEHGYEIQVVGVVKDDKHRPKEIRGNRMITRTYEKQILLANAEAHRFAIAYHRKKRKIV